MDIKICDRCGKNCNKEKKVSGNSINDILANMAESLKEAINPEQKPIRVKIFDINNYNDNEYDLCADCAKKLYEFMEGKENGSCGVSEESNENSKGDFVSNAKQPSC